MRAYINESKHDGNELSIITMKCKYYMCCNYTNLQLLMHTYCTIAIEYACNSRKQKCFLKQLIVRELAYF